MKRVIRASNNVTNYVAGVMDVNISYYMVVSCFLCGFHDNSDGEAFKSITPCVCAAADMRVP